MTNPETNDQIIFPEGFVNPLSELLEQNDGGTVVVTSDELMDALYRTLEAIPETKEGDQ